MKVTLEDTIKIFWDARDECYVAQNGGLTCDGEDYGIALNNLIDLMEAIMKDEDK